MGVWTLPVKSEKSFRTSMLGFNRQDVLEYISAHARDHKRELSALRAERDKLRAERDAFSEQLVELSAQHGRASQMEKVVEELRDEIGGLNREKTQLGSRENELMSEIGRLTVQVQKFEAAEKALGDAKLRAEELEMQAYRRAEEIEAEAGANREKLQESARDSVYELKEKLGALRLEADKAARDMMLELEKMSSWYSHFGDVFKVTEDKIRELLGDGKAPVHEFVPKEF